MSVEATKQDLGSQSAQFPSLRYKQSQERQSGPNQSAWQKAMEQQQASDWLNLGLTARAEVEHVSQPLARDVQLTSPSNVTVSSALKPGSRYFDSSIGDKKNDSRDSTSPMQSDGKEVGSKREQPSVGDDQRGTDSDPKGMGAENASLHSARFQAIGLVTNDSVSLSGIPQGLVQIGSKEMQARFPGQLQQILASPLVEVPMLPQVLNMATFGNSILADGGASNALPTFQHLEESLVDETLGSVKGAIHADFTPVRDPVRFHAEWSEQGVRLWLGVDVGAGIDLTYVGQQLKAWLNQHGCALISLTCNGSNVGTKFLSDEPSDDMEREKASIHPFQRSRIAFHIPQPFPNAYFSEQET